MPVRRKKRSKKKNASNKPEVIPEPEVPEIEEGSEPEPEEEPVSEEVAISEGSGEVSEEDSSDLQALESMTYRELQQKAKEVCEELGVDINRSAKKAVLLKELQDALSGGGEPEPKEPEEVEEEPPDKEAEVQDDDPEVPKMEGADAEVLRVDASDEGADSEALKEKILEWIADGFDVSYLEEALEEGSDEIDIMVSAAESAILDIIQIKEELNGLNVTGMEGEVKDLMKVLNDPRNIETTREQFKTLKKKVHDYKESFFEDNITEQFVYKKDEPKPKKQTTASKEPMEVKDVFLLTREGRFITHHTTRVISKSEQQILFNDLKMVRAHIKSPKFANGKLNSIAIDVRHLLMLGGDHVVAVLIVDGSVRPGVEKLLQKVVGLIEKDDGPAIDNWGGDLSELKSVKKYMNALLYACIRLAKKGQSA